MFISNGDQWQTRSQSVEASLVTLHQHAWKRRRWESYNLWFAINNAWTRTIGSAVSRLSIVLCRSLKKVKTIVSSFWLIFHVFNTVSDCSEVELLLFSLSSPLFLYNEYFLSWVVTIIISFGRFVNRLWISSNVSSSSPQRPNGTLLSCRKPCTGQYIWLLIQCEVKLAGYWSNFCVVMDWGQYPAILAEQGYDMRETAGNPE